MADKKYFDVDGNPIATKKIKQYFDLQGEPYKDPITQMGEKVAPFVGRAAVEALPFAGSFLGPGGTIAGYGAMNALKSLKPELVGEPAQGFGDQAGGIVKELLLNNALPKVLGGLGKLVTQVGMQGPKAATALTLSNFPAVRNEATKRMSEQLMKRTNTPSMIMEAGAENATNKLGELHDEVASQIAAHPRTYSPDPTTLLPVKDPIHPDILAATQVLENHFGKNRSGKMLLDMQKQVEAGKDVAGSESYKTLANKVLSDITEIRNTKLVAGHEFPRDLAMTKLLTDGFKSSEGIVDATAVLNEMSGKNWEIYKEAIPARTLASVKELLETIKELQTGHKVMDTLIHLSENKLFYGAAAGAAGMGMHTITGVAGGAAAGLQITNVMLRKLMQNPETAKLVTKALQTSQKAPEADLLNEVLTRVFQGGTDLAAVPER